MQLLLGTAHCPFGIPGGKMGKCPPCQPLNSHSCCCSCSCPTRRFLSTQGKPNPSKQRRAPRTDSGNTDTHLPLNPWDLPSSSTLEFHPSGLPWSLEQPKKAASKPSLFPQSWAWHIQSPFRAPHLPGQVGRAGRAPTGSEGGSQPCSNRESLILHQGNKQKALLGFSLGEDGGMGQEEGTQSLEHGLGLSPCAENYIFV